MKGGRERVFLIPPDGTQPPTGLFAVRFVRNGLERGVCIKHNDGFWEIYVDGVLCGRNESWSIALHGFTKLTYFIGRPVDAEEYMRILNKRREDVSSGLDIDAPIDLNQIRPH